jgi:hypothetical protein
MTQGSSCLATLGWVTESRWDSPKGWLQETPSAGFKNSGARRACHCRIAETKQAAPSLVPPVETEFVICVNTPD